MAAVGALQPGEEKLFEGQPRGFPFEGFQLEDVMLPEDDDMGIPSEDEVDDEEELETETGFGSVIGANSRQGLACWMSSIICKEQSGGQGLPYSAFLYAQAGEGLPGAVKLASICSVHTASTCRLVCVAVSAGNILTGSVVLHMI